jgi:hypothetical protein
MQRQSVIVLAKEDLGLRANVPLQGGIDTTIARSKQAIGAS